MKKNILIIEDEEFFRELLRKKLVSKEYSVLEALDGEEGLKKMQEKKPDLVLLDLLLPSMTGFDVLTKAKKDPATASIPVIILSNLGQQEDIEKGLKLGAADYLIKAQSTIDEVITKIENIL